MLKVGDFVPETALVAHFPRNKVLAWMKQGKIKQMNYASPWFSCSQHCWAEGGFEKFLDFFKYLPDFHVPSVINRWVRMSVVFMFPASWIGGEGR